MTDISSSATAVDHRHGIFPKLLFFVGLPLLFAVSYVNWLEVGSDVREAGLSPELQELQQEDKQMREAEQNLARARERLEREEAKREEAEGKRKPEGELQPEPVAEKKRAAEEVLEVQREVQREAKVMQEAEQSLGQRLEKLEREGAEKKVAKTNYDVRLIMQVAVSIGLLAGTLFVILAKRYAAKDKHWAYTTVGVVIGFWLKP